VTHRISADCDMAKDIQYAAPIGCILLADDSHCVELVERTTTEDEGITTARRHIVRMNDFILEVPA
jgi:hypothetical protein